MNGIYKGDNNMNEDTIKQIIDEKLKDFAEKNKENFNDLKNDFAEKIDEIKESHNKVTDTKNNKYGAYFFRAVEIAILACVVYNVISSL